MLVNTQNTLTSWLLRILSWPIRTLNAIHARVVCRYRGASTTRGERNQSFVVSGIDFREYLINVNNDDHRITEAGSTQVSGRHTIVFMGGIPTDASETFYWLVAALCRVNTSLRCVIVQLPFVESHTRLSFSKDSKARYEARSIPFNQAIDLSETPIDPRFDHHNQAITAAQILNAMNITSAHFVGHDRGAVVFDYLIGANPSIAHSFCRGAQLWDHYDDAWSTLAPQLIVGPPHRQMVIPWQCQLLFLAVIRLKRPINLLSPGFVSVVAGAKRGSEEYDRKTHLLYKSLAVPKRIRTIISQIMMQTDSTDEVRHREILKSTHVPIMQFQGEDEFAFDKQGILISDQPYFGRYNLFANDVYDLFPEAVGQEPTRKVGGLVQEFDHYKSLKLKPTARLNRFCLIPNAAHFNVVENPLACAHAINDFVTDNTAR